MKKLVFILTMCLCSFILGKTQFTYFGYTTADIIYSLTNPQKLGTLNSFAEGKSIKYVRHTYYIPQYKVVELYSLFDDVNTSADTSLLAHPSVDNYTLLLDSLEAWFADEEIQRNWLDAIMRKKVDYCTHPDTLAGLNDAEKWAKYLELLRLQ